MPHGHFHHFLLKVYCIAAIIATIFDIPCCNPTSMLYCTGYHPYTGRKRGVYLVSVISSFLISVLASVAAYYICKWLDGKM